MNPSFHIIDFVIVGIYAILLVGVGLWVSRTKKGHTKTAEDYFLASKALPWWAIGSSLIAANISAEQFIGMSGSGFAGLPDGVLRFGTAHPGARKAPGQNGNPL